MVDFSKVKTYSLKTRTSKLSRRDLARAPVRSGSFLGFYDALPRVLKANDLRSLVEAIVKAHKRNKPVIFMSGAHIIKCGLSPVIIELIKRKIITCISFNGAGIIHDFEVAYQGKTSEDVDASLGRGKFGMGRQTAQFINRAISEGVADGLGIGDSVGQAMARQKLPYKNLSIIYQAVKSKIPVTVHIAIGTDIIHQHPDFDPAAAGKGSGRDFKILTGVISRLGQGGIVLNFGSAVILPEVFLKALNLSRNLGFNVKGFTTANFDMIYHYRPAENVVRRPVMPGGKGYYIVGHHEIMLPLLAQAVIDHIK